MSEELELYKLVMSNRTHEFGWVSENDFIVWILFSMFEDFIYELKRIFGNEIFEDGGFQANIQEEFVCINLHEVINDYVDLEYVFPKDEYRH